MTLEWLVDWAPRDPPSPSPASRLPLPFPRLVTTPPLPPASAGASPPPSLEGRAEHHPSLNLRGGGMEAANVAAADPVVQAVRGRVG